MVGDLPQCMHAPLDAWTDAVPLHDVHRPLEDVGERTYGVAPDRLLQHVLQDLPQLDHPVLALHSCVIDHCPYVFVQLCRHLGCHVHPLPPTFRVQCSDYITEVTMQPNGCRRDSYAANLWLVLCFDVPNQLHGPFLDCPMSLRDDELLSLLCGPEGVAMPPIARLPAGVVCHVSDIAETRWDLPVA